MKNLAFLVAVGALIGSGTVNATTITETFHASYGAGDTFVPLGDWGQNPYGPAALTIPQFDPSKGSLLSISILLEGWVAGQLAAENTGVTGTTVTQTISAQLTLTRPSGGSNLVVILPTFTGESVSLGAFDGIVDCLGSSGYTEPVYENRTVGSTTYNSSQLILTSSSGTWATDSALFTGTASIDLPMQAKSKGTLEKNSSNYVVDGSGASALGRATVIYTYDAVVPEPSTMFLLGSALVAVGVFWRKKIVN